MTREFADELLELIKAEPEHLIVLPVEYKDRKRKWGQASLGPTTWLICHASVDENDEYDLRPIAEVIGPDQRLRFDKYHNPLIDIKDVI